MYIYEKIFKKMVTYFMFAGLFHLSLLADTPPTVPDIFVDTNETLTPIIYGINLSKENNISIITHDNNWSIGKDKNATLPFNSFENAFEINTTNGLTNVNGWEDALVSPAVHLKSGHNYQLVVYIKTDVFPKGQNIVVKVDGPGKSGDTEYAWNVSKANEWEEVILPVYPLVDGEWRVKFWTYDRTKYAETNSTIFISSDIDLFELPAGRELMSTHDINIDKNKTTFQSTTHKIDGWGNFYLKHDDEIWEHIFPKMIYKGPGKNYFELFARYKEYGFNGVMDIWTANQAQIALDAGLTNISINSICCDMPLEAMVGYIDQVYNWAENNNTHSNILWYNFDNENKSIGDFQYQKQLAAHIDTNHTDPLTNMRRHPIYYLNGQVGLPRTYNNDSRNVMDITGSYVGSDSIGGASDIMVPTLLTQFLTQNQKTPATVIQLQHDLNETFIPALFYGIIQGGRALSVWRDGADNNGSKIDFRSKIWAEAFRDEISPRLDQMMPIIEQPHITSWTAATDKFPDVRIGTRELNDLGYLILSNFTNKDTLVKVTLNDFNASKAVDFFTEEFIADINNSDFNFTMEHNNSGYKVIKLVK